MVAMARRPDRNEASDDDADNDLAAHAGFLGRRKPVVWKSQRSDVAQEINATVTHLLQPQRSLRSTSPLLFSFFFSNLNEATTHNSHQKACKHTVKDYNNTQPYRTHDSVMPSGLWLPSLSKLSQTSGLAISAFG